MYDREGHTVNNKYEITCIILLLFGFTVHWSAKYQPASDTHSTYYEFKNYNWTQIVFNKFIISLKKWL